MISKSSSAYATTAASLAGRKRRPVLMTSGTSLDSWVQTEPKRMPPKGKTVYPVGGTKVLGSSVASKVTSLGYVAKRLSDASRYSTSVAVAKAITSTPKYVFPATGTDHRDALAASSAAGSTGGSGTAVVLLTDGSTMTASVYGHPNKYSPSTPKIITVGIDAEPALAKAHKAHKAYKAYKAYKEPDTRRSLGVDARPDLHDDVRVRLVALLVAPEEDPHVPRP
ncbi:cell wall-binding repeat-containing protein [Streptomyces sp. NPDC001070]